MIDHIVLLRFRPGVQADSEAVRTAHAAMLALPARIPQIKAWKCGLNITQDITAWDYVLVARFESEAAMNEYFEHPEHLKVVAIWEPISELAFGDLPD
ncbi:MAG: Dabb family protein [Betaproteobacteria bacterium]|nr:Dabb family protein [Betaproteobacteria bacterium]